MTAITSKPLLRVPLDIWHCAHGAHMIEHDGWQVPSCYTDVEREVGISHSTLVIADITPFAKVALHGRGVGAFTRTLAGDASAAKPLGVSRFDGGLACRLAEDQMLLLASSPRLTTPQIHVTALSLDASAIDGVSVVNQTCALAGFALLGADATSTLHKLTALDLPESLPPNSCAWTNMAGVAVLLVHCEESAVPSLRLYVAWDLAEYLWGRLLDVARPIPIGLDAWLSLLA